MKIYFILPLLVGLAFIKAPSEKASTNFLTSQSDSLTGTWRGTSICQVKSSPCHDEIAVYHLSKTKDPNVYEWVMNKMVNGVEEDMGVMNYNYDSNTKTFTGHIRPTDKWKFVVKGNTMAGTLVVRDSVLYRVINLVKDR